MISFNLVHRNLILIIVTWNLFFQHFLNNSPLFILQQTILVECTLSNYFKFCKPSIDRLQNNNNGGRCKSFCHLLIWVVITTTQLSCINLYNRVQIASTNWLKGIFQRCCGLIQHGIRRCLIGVGSITEVKQRRARFIIGWVTAWDCQVPYTLGHACSDVVSWGSDNHVIQMARLTDFELDVKEPQWT